MIRHANVCLWQDALRSSGAGDSLLDGPYAQYEIHLHPTYRTPVLWFHLHNLPNDARSFDIESVYRYLVPDVLKAELRSVGVIGGISADVRLNLFYGVYKTMLISHTAPSHYGPSLLFYAPMQHQGGHGTVPSQAQRLLDDLAWYRWVLCWLTVATCHGMNVFNNILEKAMPKLTYFC